MVENFREFMRELVVVLNDWTFEMIGKAEDGRVAKLLHPSGATIHLTLDWNGEYLLSRVDGTEDWYRTKLEPDPRKTAIRLLNSVVRPYLNLVLVS